MRHLRIPEEWFLEEEREGFLVPAKMKRCWAAKLEMVARMGEIFDRHGLTWWINYGTLIGAVRHRGFVPWDDDVDICLPRADYEAGLAALEAEFSPDCHVVRLGEEVIGGTRGAWCTFFNRQHTDTGEDPREIQVSAEFFDWPYICNVDIFPMDHLPRDVARREQLRATLSALIPLAYGSEAPDETSQREAHRTFEALAAECPREAALGYMQAYWWCKNERAWWPFSCYDTTVRLPFEMTRLPAPCGFQRLLAVEYGDWMKPVRGTAMHDYPSYKEQERWLDSYHLSRAVERASDLLSDGKRLEARDVLLRGLERSPGHYQLYYLLARSYLGESLGQVVAWLAKSLAACDDAEDRAMIQEEFLKIRGFVNTALTEASDGNQSGFGG